MGRPRPPAAAGRSAPGPLPEVPEAARPTAGPLACGELVPRRGPRRGRGGGPAVRPEKPSAAGSVPARSRPPLRPAPTLRRRLASPPETGSPEAAGPRWGWDGPRGGRGPAGVCFGRGCVRRGLAAFTCPEPVPPAPPGSPAWHERERRPRRSGGGGLGDLRPAAPRPRGRGRGGGGGRGGPHAPVACSRVRSTAAGGAPKGAAILLLLCVWGPPGDPDTVGFAAAFGLRLLRSGGEA